MGELRFTILGCGSSGGVPRIGNFWGDCDPDNPKNRRSRCSLLIERRTEDGTTRVLIDTSPDMRHQLNNVGVGHLDAVAYTHAHADHMHGLDDLRMVVFNRGSRLPVWADAATQADLMLRFAYAFEQPEGSPYPPILTMHPIEGPFSITGAGGTIDLTPITVTHGTIHALAFKVGDFAYLPDVSAIPEAVQHHFHGLDCWVLDALRRNPHPSHIHLEETLEWIAAYKPRRAILTDMHVDLDYATLERETPDHITPAYDGMTVSYPV